MNITRTVLDALKPQLSERDYAILSDVGRFKLLTAGQVERLHFSACSPTSRTRNRQAVLKRLTDHRVLARVGQRPRGGPRGGSQGFVYTLDVAGQHLAQLTSSRPRRPYIWYEPNVAHYLAVAELYVQLVEADRAGQLTLLTFEAEPYCWRTFGSRTVKPDAFVQVGVLHGTQRRKGSFFVEVDRGDQWGTKVSSKLSLYLDYWSYEQSSGLTFPQVLLLASNERRANYLQQLTAKRISKVPIFRVGLLDAALTTMAEDGRREPTFLARQGKYCNARSATPENPEFRMCRPCHMPEWSSSRKHTANV